LETETCIAAYCTPPDAPSWNLRGHFSGRDGREESEELTVGGEGYGEDREQRQRHTTLV